MTLYILQPSIIYLLKKKIPGKKKKILNIGNFFKNMISGLA